MQNLIMFKEGEPSFITWIKKRLANNLNFICLFQGSTGIGKTWAGISMAYQLDNSFNVSQIVFDFKELMVLINSEEFKKKKIKIVLFDEPQITISNRNWQSLNNKLMNYLLSTFRHQNIILIFCSPYKDFLDSQSMKLLHCIFECVGVNKKTELSRVRPKIQQYNASMKKTYQHALQVIRGKNIFPLRDWHIQKPPLNLIKEYEEKKTNFTSNLNKEIQTKLEKLSGGDKPKEETLKEIIAERLNDPYSYRLRGRKPLTAMQEAVMRCLTTHTYNEASKILGMNRSSVNAHKRLAVKKGYTTQEFKEDAV